MLSATREAILDIDVTIITALVTGLGGAIAGASKHTAAIISAVRDALIAKDQANSRKLRHRLREVEGQAALCQVERRVDQPDLLDVLDRAFEDLPILAGVVCERGYYVRTVGYERWLGHHETAGLPWDDPRFVHPEDVEHSHEVAAKGVGPGNRGERIGLMNARGVRFEAEVWSMRPVMAGKRSYRFFVVRLIL